MKSINDLLRELREDKDLKQADIAAILNLSQQQYSRYETDSSEIPLNALSTLADFYGVSADYLMGRKDCMSGVPGLDKRVTDDYTAGEILSDLLSLDAKGRAYVLESLSLQKLRAACEKNKDGRRT